jgi:hypothetical protein
MYGEREEQKLFISCCAINKLVLPMTTNIKLGETQNKK